MYIGPSPEYLEALRRITRVNDDSLAAALRPLIAGDPNFFYEISVALSAVRFGLYDRLASVQSKREFEERVFREYDFSRSQARMVSSYRDDPKNGELSTD